MDSARAEQAAALAIWRGDVGLAIALLVKSNALTADFVSLSMLAGRDAWQVR